MQKQRTSRTSSVGYLVAVGVTAKLFIDTSVQLYNPFLMVFAAGLGVSAVTMGQLVSLRNIMGLVAPVVGHMADRIGYRLIMRVSLLLAGIGVLLLSTGAGLPVLILSMVVAGLGQGGFTPTLHSYLSSKLPYEKRSRYLGIVEYSWALAGIIGLALIGVLIELFSWREPLYVLGGGLIAAAVLLGTLPKAESSQHADSEDGGGVDTGAVPAARQSAAPAAAGAVEPSEPPRSRAARLVHFFYLGEHWKSAWSAVLVNVFNFFAITHIMIIHGGWLEMEYGLAPSKLGLVALLLGLFDWAGSIIVSIAGDRIGKRKSVLIGAGGMVVFFSLLPFLNISLPLALVSLLLPRFFFEFATVSNFPLLSEQYPLQRGKIMSLSVAGGLLGTTVAATTGPAAYLHLGVWGLGPFSAAAAAVSCILIVVFVREEPYRRNAYE
ncbi:MAG TPA: MFS transporter [Clostridia bacterium]|nr:MFS transporter [Clostridia bacterium]